MRTYLILKEKAEQFRKDRKIQDLLSEIHPSNSTWSEAMSSYSSQSAQRIREADLDRRQLSSRRLAYERLDQLTVDLLLGVR